MRIEFKEEERDYIVNNPETDLLLTEVGMSLVDARSGNGAVISVEATGTETQRFLDELRDEFNRKINRVVHPSLLRGLARRLLPDYAHVASQTDHRHRGG